jgi:dTDP-4-amino-4,6-dideoxygalactose transaminase
MIPINKPFLPPREDYEELLDGIWERQWLTNTGPLVIELENQLKQHLGVSQALFVTNGTLALQFAIRALRLTGEVITTPYTYVATSSSLVWEGCTPVFTDIDRDSLNIDPLRIEAAITENTTAILATHIFGNPCDVEAIQHIADRHNLKVIYDGAHAFGVNVNGKSVFNYGDISICSFHATKVFHTGEGGLIVTRDENLLRDMTYMHNFGHDGPGKFYGLGINGKNSELHAAMGLANIKYIREVHKKRKALSERYDMNLSGLDAVKPKWHSDSHNNYAYYPLIFPGEDQLMECIKACTDREIFGRRYFYPSLAKCLPYLDTKSLPGADDLSKRVFCLPLFYDLTMEDVDLVCETLMRIQKH